MTEKFGAQWYMDRTNLHMALWCYFALRLARSFVQTFNEHSVMLKAYLHVGIVRREFSTVGDGTTDMNVTAQVIIALATTLCASLSTAQDAEFGGTWVLDFRTPDERQQNAECGFAEFKLKQTGRQITGSHTMATVGCGRVNEGGDGSVSGQVNGNVATLRVTSRRNGAQVLGTAMFRSGLLQWQVVRTLKPGLPEGESALILERGLLSRVAD